MKGSIRCCIALLLGAVPWAHGGEIGFDPAFRVVDPEERTTFTVDIYVQSAPWLGTFDAVDIFARSDGPVFKRFDFDADFIEATDWMGESFRAAMIVDGEGVLMVGFLLGGFSPDPFVPPTRIGTVTLDVEGLPTGVYMLEIDGEEDGGRSSLALRGETEPVFGSIQIAVVDESSAACESDSDCETGNECLDSSCLSGRCVSFFAHSSCDDEDACTWGDECRRGVCVGMPSPECCYRHDECDDHNLCTDDVCIANACEHWPNTRACDDGNPCTDWDRCQQGECRGEGLAVCCYVDNECEDANECTMDFCVGGQCEHVPASWACDDHDSCTANDRCVGGECQGEAIAGCCEHQEECEDDNPCTMDVCIGGWCRYFETVGACDDGDPCTVFDRCLFGECVGDESMDCCLRDADCDDGDDCTEDACDTHQCVHVPIDDCGELAGLGLPATEPDGPGAPGLGTEAVGDVAEGTAEHHATIGDSDGTGDEGDPAAQPDDARASEPKVTSPGGLMCGAVGIWTWCLSLAGLVALRRRGRLVRS